MTVSSEPRGRRVTMPDVVGLDVHDARAVLRNSGIASFRVHYMETYAAEHSVVAQEPRGGLLIEREQAIVLSVCRRNLVQYLPQVYQQAATPDSFLRGFLYVVQQVSDSVASHIAHMHELFDPRTAREEFLPWLASWLSITLSPDWDELQRRQMLLTATRLFPYRGTVRSIREFVRIYTGSEVQVEENSWPYDGFRIGVSSAIGLDTVILPPMNLAHCFVVRLDRPGAEVSDEEIIKIHQIIQVQKPAHTSYFLAFSDHDDSEGMAVFVEIGSSAIGVGGMGMGVGVGVPLDSAPLASQSEASASDASSSEIRKRQKAADVEQSIDSPAKVKVEDEADVSESAEGASDDEVAARRTARKERAAAAAAARAERKERAALRAKEREERSNTGIPAMSDEDSESTPEAVDAPEPKTSSAKSPKGASKAAVAAQARAERKAASERRAAEREAKKASKAGTSKTKKDVEKESAKSAEGAAASKQEARRKRSEAAAAAREERKAAAAARAAERAAKKGAKPKAEPAAKKATKSKPTKAKAKTTSKSASKAKAPAKKKS